MESDRQLIDDSSKTSSSEESNKPDDDKVSKVVDDVGTASRSYYECVFCKRGFTTAQALGGHMNIHRRDRAASRVHRQPAATAAVLNVNPSPQPAPIPLNQPIEYYARPSSTSFPKPSSAHHQYLPYQMYFPPSTSTSTTTHVPAASGSYHGGDNLDIINYHHQNPRASSRFDVDEDWCTSLSLQIGPSHIDKEEEEEEEEEEKRPDWKEDHELDLELRLGHHHDP